MCDPLTIAGAVLTGASAAANSAAQAKVQSARDDAMAAERVRQKGYDQEAAARNAHAQDQYKDVATSQGERAKSLSDYFTTQQAQPVADNGPVALPASSSNVTNIATTNAKADAKAMTDKTGAALGQLRSFGDIMGQFARGTARDAGYIDQIGGFKKGSSAVLPYELEAANSKGSNMKLFGDILGGLGKIGIGAGLSGATPFGIGSTAANNVTSFGAGATRALGGALDRASMPGYSTTTAGFNPFSWFR